MEDLKELRDSDNFVSWGKVKVKMEDLKVHLCVHVKQFNRLTRLVLA